MQYTGKVNARSRLKNQSPEVKPVAPAPVFQDVPHHHRLPKEPSFLANIAAHNPISVAAHVKQLPTFVVSLLFFALLYALMVNVRPSTIKDLLLPDLYLPFQLLLFMGTFFLFSFVWLHSRRGYLTALFFQVLLFLGLQRVTITWQFTLGLAVFFVIIETIATLLQKRLKTNSETRHANVKQSFIPRRRRTTARPVIYDARWVLYTSRHAAFFA